MADRKISELNAADSANLHASALLHLVDLTELQASDQNVKATLAQMKGVFGTVDAFDVTVQSPSSATLLSGGASLTVTSLAVSLAPSHVLKIKRIRSLMSPDIAPRIYCSQSTTEYIGVNPPNAYMDSALDVTLSTVTGINYVYFSFKHIQGPVEATVGTTSGFWVRFEIEAT